MTRPRIYQMARPGESPIHDNRAQIEQLFHQQARGVGNYVLVRTADAELAETITARVFAIVVQRFEQCRGNNTAWLWSIVRSELARYFRDESRRRGLPLNELMPDADDSPHQRLARRESTEQLSAALDELNEQDSTVVYMKFFQQMPNTEIARATGLTPTNVGVKLHRILKRLRDKLEPVREGEAPAEPLDRKRSNKARQEPRPPEQINSGATT